MGSAMLQSGWGSPSGQFWGSCLLVTLLSLRRRLVVVVKSFGSFFLRARPPVVYEKPPFEHKSTPYDANAQLDANVGKEVATAGPQLRLFSRRPWNLQSGNIA